MLGREGLLVGAELRGWGAFGRSNRSGSRSRASPRGAEVGRCEQLGCVVVVELVGVGRRPLGGLLVDLQRGAGEAGVPTSVVNAAVADEPSVPGGYSAAICAARAAVTPSATAISFW